MSRRTFLRGSAAVAALGAAGIGAQLPRRTAMAAPDGSLASSMAMHIHSSFSEQVGSMESQLFQARKNAVDVLWWTDHDARMLGIGYRDTVHFTSLLNEQGGPGEGAAWHWTQEGSGKRSADSGGSIVDAPASPKDPASKGSLRVRCESTSTAAASAGVYGDSHPAGWDYRCSLIGQSLAIEVLPSSVGVNAYLEIRLDTSFHNAPVAGGRSGVYTLSYRIGGPDAPGSRRISGLTGIITLSAGSGSWRSVVLKPAEDIAALWPALDSRDFALSGITLNAVTTGRATAAGNFDYLRFTRASGEVQLRAQQNMMAELAHQFPTVHQHQGLEVSSWEPHLNWFGGVVTLPDYRGITYAGYQGWLDKTVVPHIHTAGGIASYNHPFGAAGGPQLSQAAQDQRLQKIAARLLNNDVLGCDVMEVGYLVRGHVDLAHHVGLWDVLSRNARFITGNGASDDHMGMDWFDLGNGWTTSTWSKNRYEKSLVQAVQSGRAWSGLLKSYRGNLDLLVDGTCPMGSASVSSLSRRALRITATDIPKGGKLQLVQGAVDYAGPAHAMPTSRVVGSFTAAQLAAGTVATTVDTSADSFVRTQVVAGNGAVVALSNPAWLLRTRPPKGIPAVRAC